MFYVFLYIAICPERPVEGIRFPKARVAGHCELPESCARNHIEDMSWSTFS